MFLGLPCLVNSVTELYMLMRLAVRRLIGVWERSAAGDRVGRTELVAAVGTAPVVVDLVFGQNGPQVSLAEDPWRREARRQLGARLLRQFRPGEWCRHLACSACLRVR